MSWRVARSLLTLRDQIDARYPDRDRASDGTIGDADHRTRDSDHNPHYLGHIVTALDITHDPGAGVDIDRLTDELAASRDHRIKYVIANNLIMSGADGPSPWVWRHYGGSNPHTRHFHLSVVASPACDDTTLWNLPSLRTGGGGAPPGREDDMSIHDVIGQRPDGTNITVGEALVNLYLGAFFGGGDAGERPAFQAANEAADLGGRIAALAELVGRTSGVTAEEIAAALRTGLVEDLLPTLREVMRDVFDDDNAEQAEEMAQAVVDELGTRLGPVVAGQEQEVASA